jgi:hypothetical protein
MGWGWNGDRMGIGWGLGLYYDLLFWCGRGLEMKWAEERWVIVSCPCHPFVWISVLRRFFACFASLFWRTLEGTYSLIHPP